MKTFLSIIGIITLTVVGAMLNGYTLAVLWRWFVASKFGLPALSITDAIGLALIVGYLTAHQSNCTKREKDFSAEMLESLGHSMAKPLFALFFGWLVTLFMR